MECKHEFTMCRLCLCESESFIDIFRVNEWFGYIAAEVIRDLLQFQVSETDGYPNVVCSICLGKLTDFKQFKQQCQNSRDTYDNVFASDESHPEHTIYIEPSEFIKTEMEEERNDADASTEADLDTAYSEEEETITDDIPSQVEISPVKLELKDPLDTRESQQEIRKCSIAFTSLEHLTRHQNRTRSESYGPYEDGRSSVNDDGEPLLKRRKNAAVDANPCENMKSSGSAGVKVGKMDIKVGKYCKYPGERMYVFPDEKSDLNGEETSVGESRRGGLRRREEVNYVETSVGERDSDTEGGNERERGEVNEREGNEEYFRCRDRGNEFEKKDALTRHLRARGCDVNGKSIRDKRDFQVDTDVNRGSNGKTSDSLENGSERRDDAVKKYVCDSCGKDFKGTYHLKVHLRVHSGEKPFPCDVCGKCFRDKAYLRTHEYVHTGVKPYACQECGARFARKSHLVDHGRTHDGKKPHACETCARAFDRKGDLVQHRRVHSGEKPYKCETCGVPFARKDHLKLHARVHSGEKPYACEECNKCFSDSSNLRRHLTTHTQERPYVCKVCSNSFTDISSLRRHLRIHSR